MQMGTALSISPTAVLSSLIGVCGFILLPSIVHVKGTDWKERESLYCVHISLNFWMMLSRMLEIVLNGKLVMPHLKDR